MSRAVPLARPARGPRLVLLVALPLLCLVKPAAGAGSAYGFNTYDADKNGKLEPIEFVKFLQNTPAKGSKKGQVQQMFKGMDTDNDNGVSEDEFNVFLESMAPPPPTPQSSKKPKKPKKPEGANTRDELTALEAFYAKHDPKKIAGLPKLLARAAAKNKKTWFQEMSKALEEKYGDSPANYMPGANTPGAKAGKKAGADRKASKSKEKAADKLQQSRRQVLVEFYKKHVPEKTASDVDAIIAKRQSKGKNWFDELCAKLKAKYGEDPADGLATGSGAAEEAASSSSSSRSSNDDADSESKAKKQRKTQSEKKKKKPDSKPESSSEKKKKKKPDSKPESSSNKNKKKPDSKPESSSNKNKKKPDSKPESSSKKKPQSDKKKKRGVVTEKQRSVLAAFYAKHAPKKTAKSIAKMITSTSANEGDDWFDNLCAALKGKYGEDPRTMTKADATKATGEDTKGADDAAADSEPKASEAAAGGGEGGAAEPAPKDGDEGEAPTVSTEAGTSERQKLLDRLLAAVGGIDDLGALEEELVKKAEALQEEEALAAEKEAQAKAEEEARIKAEKKAAARKRAAEARAVAAEKLKAAEEAEEAALNLESFDPIDLDDENKMVLMDSEVVAWLEENRLSGYTHQIARFGGKFSELRMRVKAADMEAMGMSKPEMARMKKALKKLRKEARELAAAQAAAEDDDQAKEDDDAGTDDDAKETKKTSKAKA